MDYPELPIGYPIMMTPDPEGTPLIAYDAQDMRAYVDADRAQRAEPAGWQHRVYYTDNNDPGWSKWREVLECDMGNLQKLACEYPARHQMRQVYTAPQQSAQPVYSWAIPQGEIYAEADTGKFTMGMLIARDKQDPEYDPTNKHFVYGFHAASPTARLRGYRDGFAAAQPVEVQPVAAANGWAKGLEIRMSQGWKLKGGICPVLYSDTVNGYGVGRDDLWLATTDALKSAQPVGVQSLTDATQFEKDVARWMEKDGLTREQAECEVNYRTTRKALK